MIGTARSGHAASPASSRRLDPRHLPLLVTLALFLAMAVTGGVLYPGFLSPQVFLNLLIDNAFLCVAAVGATFVILTGGIDLSVGAVIAFTTVLLAMLVQQSGWHPLAAIPVVLALGSAFGAAILAMVGAGWYVSVADACTDWIKQGAITEPGPERAAYETQYATYRALYPALKDIFHKLG